MRPTEPPLIIRQQARDLLIEMIRRIPAQFPAWKPAVPGDDDAVLGVADDARDFGMTLLKLAARMGEVVAGQINRAPQKNFLAFLDFLGMDRAPPKAARVPLTFALAEKAPTDRLVPQGTQVGAGGGEEAVFETEADLLVTRTTLSGAFSVDPREDRHIDLGRLISGSGSHELAVFGASSGWRANTHALFVGHDTLLTHAEQAGADITVTITGTLDASLLLDWAYSTAQGWVPVAATAATGSVGERVYAFKTPGIASMTLTGHDESGAATGRSGCWLRAEAPAVVPMTITRIELGTRIDDQPVPAWLACFNSAPLDVSKDFFPFGERPKFNDTFYVASRQAFGTAGARVRLSVALSQALPQPPDAVSLSWEYWDGDTWSLVGTSDPHGPGVDQGFQFSDTSQAFTRDGTVTFECPPMARTVVNGVQDFWLRIRITAGGYGQEAGYRQTTNQALQAGLETIETDPGKLQDILDLLTANGLVDTFVFVAESYAVPSIRSLALSYSTESTEPAEAIFTENGFVLRDVTQTGSFEPFLPWPDVRPALYLEFNPATTSAGTPLSVYLQVVQPVYGSRAADPAVGSAGPASVAWWFWGGTAWQRLLAEDGTGHLAHSGMLRFIWPANAQSRPLFGRPGAWIRASLESGGYPAAPRLGALAPNTVWARHGLSFRDHVLGSSNGHPTQTFRFARAPVLPGQGVEVREPTLPGDADRRRIAADAGPDAVRTVVDAAGNLLEVWVRWQAVPSLSLSSASDRHYVLDHVTGTLVFGDGVQGRIPPAGRDNVVARLFRAGGGAAGLCPPRSLTDMKTPIAYIASVVNHEAAFGGMDAETVDKVLAHAPWRIKSRDRAVTAEDYEWLAREAAGEVARARCLPLTQAGSLADANRPGGDPGWVTVIIVPQGRQDQPLPSEPLIAAVRGHLAQRACATLSGRIDVIGPRYVAVRVAATFVPRHLGEAKTVELRVRERLQAFLHPLTGGPGGDGWEFGRSVHLSEIAAVLQGTEGLDRVSNLSLWRPGHPDALERIRLASHELPASGDHDIKATGA